jgi:DNA (cytosine-5)-methyltransferase 1
VESAERPLQSIEICAGAGGQALGLERAGFDHVALLEIDKWACQTLIKNRPHWNVIQGDIREFTPDVSQEIDLLAGGVPCPPFSIAGHGLGPEDDRDLFPEALRLAFELEPKAVLLENVRGLLSPKFHGYRSHIARRLKELGYSSEWRLLNASDFRVPQLRPRAILVALRDDYWPYFRWPEPSGIPPCTVGGTLIGEMASLGWRGAAEWAEKADGIAPTLVGGSKKHGGADLGPTRAREAWSRLGVDGRGIADAPPEQDFQGLPRLTVRMAAMIQGFPVDWEIAGGKTAAYRQVGNAFPPPVAEAVGRSICNAISAKLGTDMVKTAFSYPQVTGDERQLVLLETA